MEEAFLSNQWDILLFADFAQSGDAGFRLSQEVRCHHSMGLRVGVVHLANPTNVSVVSPDIRMCVREGLAEIVPPTQGGFAKLAIVYAPSTIQPQNLSAFSADRVILVHDRKADPKKVGNWLSFHFGDVTWAPSNRWVRSSLLALDLPIPLTEMDWRPLATELRSETAKKRLSSAKPIFGRVSAAGAAQWPETYEKIRDAYPIGNAYEFRVIGAPPNKLLKALETQANVAIFKPDEICVERFLQMLDVFFYFPGHQAPAMPEAAIATMMASGKLVVLPKHLECHYGPGALYADAVDALQAVENLLNDENAANAKREEAIYHSQFQFSEERYRSQVLDLLDLEKPPKRSARNNKEMPKKALFVASNGVGMGHVTRLLAIARRLDEQLEPVFATMAQVAPIIENFGYEAEYIPSQMDTQTNHADWDAWLRAELDALIDRHNPAVVIFDGNNPTPGLMHAVLSRAECRIVWIRRGMMQATPSPYLENAKFMDLIIEPGEIASDRDIGPTAARRGEAVLVDPITLLDREEVLDRKAARAELEIPDDASAVLIQLGSGANRDVVGLVNEIMDHLTKIPGLQIYFAEWKNSSFEYPEWPSTKVLKGFPISRYFRAFDFSISAAGYNTFHEVMAFGVPTIFIANRHPAMDNQAARAEYAQDHNAGFDLEEDQLFHLPTICQTLLNPIAQDFFRENSDPLYPGNGAAAAATAILNLLED